VSCIQVVCVQNHIETESLSLSTPSSRSGFAARADVSRHVFLLLRQLLADLPKVAYVFGESVRNCHDGRTPPKNRQSESLKTTFPASALIRHLSVSCTVELPATFAQNANLRKMKRMERVVIVGRGASGKSTLARRLGDITGLPVTEVDKIFWQAGLIATPRQQWIEMQEQLAVGDRWIMEGDLGPFDAIEVRLRAADTVILLDFSLVRCAWRAIRRSRERADFWRWLLAYRIQSLPKLKAAITVHAPNAVLHVVRNPRALARFVADVSHR
jgi:hypothetical protein